MRSFNTLSNIAPRLIRADGAHVLRQAVKGLGSQPQAENQFARSASQLMIPLLRSNPLVRADLPAKLTGQICQMSLRNLGRLGGIRTYSDKLPPTSLIARYKPVLEEAVANHEELVELVEHDNFCVASFVMTALNMMPGVSSIQLDNGYLITGIRETRRVENTTARMYDLRVQPPDTLGRARKPFVLSITVYKADMFNDARPGNLKVLLGLCSTAVNIHRSKLPRKLYDSIKVFSPAFQDLGKLYSCMGVVKELISYGYVSTPAGLFEAIGNRLKADEIDPEDHFVPPLKSILIEAFKDRYPGHDQEIQRLLGNEKPPQQALFRHAIDHKGGAYRAAMKLNGFAKANPKAGISAVCVTHADEPGEQRFSIFYHPSHVWIEQRNNLQTGELESRIFAKPGQLSEALKQRGVKSIISQSLGML